LSKLPKKIVMATGNPGKIREIERLLDGLGVEIVAQSEFGVADADETGTTFAENSLIKARHASDVTGLPAIADDSGLSVDALDGAPGVYSARFAGDAGDDANNECAGWSRGTRRCFLLCRNLRSPERRAARCGGRMAGRDP
jgi:XTP/dITP diphosphohydrolase